MSTKTQMVGAGHHVRAKTNIPVVGILTQPIVKENKIMMDQYHKIKKQLEDKLISEKEYYKIVRSI